MPRIPGCSLHPSATTHPFPPGSPLPSYPCPSPCSVERNRSTALGERDLFLPLSEDGCSGVVPKPLPRRNCPGASPSLPAPVWKQITHHQERALILQGQGRGHFHRSPESWGYGTSQALRGKRSGFRLLSIWRFFPWFPLLPLPPECCMTQTHPCQNTHLRHQSCLGTGHLASR